MSGFIQKMKKIPHLQYLSIFNSSAIHTGTLLCICYHLPPSLPSWRRHGFLGFGEEQWGWYWYIDWWCVWDWEEGVGRSGGVKFRGFDTKMVNLEKEGEQRSKQGSELVFFLINSSGSLVRKKKNLLRCYIKALTSWDSPQKKWKKSHCWIYCLSLVRLLDRPGPLLALFRLVQSTHIRSWSSFETEWCLPVIPYM